MKLNVQKFKILTIRLVSCIQFKQTTIVSPIECNLRFRKRRRNSILLKKKKIHQGKNQREKERERERGTERNIDMNLEVEMQLL